MCKHSHGSMSQSNRAVSWPWLHMCCRNMNDKLEIDFEPLICLDFNGEPTLVWSCGIVSVLDYPLDFHFGKFQLSMTRISGQSIRTKDTCVQTKKLLQPYL